MSASHRSLARGRAARCASGLALATLVASFAHGADLDEVMQLLAQRRHGEASFVEQHFMRLLSRPVESLGELSFDAPDRLEKRTLEPRPEDLTVEGDTLTMTRHGRTRVISLASYPQIRPMIESLRATLAGDRAALERLFEVGFSGDPQRWSLLLVPREERIGARVAEVRIDGSRDRVLHVEIRETNGDRTRLTLREHGAR